MRDNLCENLAETITAISGALNRFYEEELKNYLLEQEHSVQGSSGSRAMQA